MNIKRYILSLLLLSVLMISGLGQSVIFDQSSLDEAEMYPEFTFGITLQDSVEFTAGTFPRIIFTSSFSFTGAPPGVIITGVEATNSRNADITIQNTQDFDTDFNNATLSIDDDELITIGNITTENNLDFNALVESASLSSSPSSLDEHDLDGSSYIQVHLNNEHFIDYTGLNLSDFTLTNFPPGTSLTGFKTSGSPKNDDNDAVIYIDHTPGDFDSDFTNCRISIDPAVLEQSTSALLSSSMTIQAITESAEVSSDQTLGEYNMDSRRLTVTLNNDYITDTSLFRPDIALANAPAGLSIDRIVFTDETEFYVYLQRSGYSDFDVDIYNFGVTMQPDYLYYNGSVLSDTTLIKAYIENPQATASPAETLREYWLDGKTVNISLTEEEFLDHFSLTGGDFGIINAPPGVSIQGISTTSPTSASIQLDFSPPQDFDISYSNVRITIDNSVLLQTESGSLTSSSFTIFPSLEPEVQWVSIPDVPMGIGSVVPVTIQITFSSDSLFSLSSGQIGGYDLYDLNKSDNNTYTAKFLVTENSNDYARNEDIPVTNLRLDDSPLTGEVFTGSISQDNDLIDTRRPVVGSLNVIGGGPKQIGDDVILLISAYEEGLTLEDTSVINLEPATAGWVLFDEIGGGTYTLTYTIQPDDQNVSPGTLAAKIYLADSAGNVNIIYPAIASNNLSIDADAPSILNITNSTGKASAIIGDTVIITVNADGNGYTLTEDSRVNGIKPEDGLFMEGTGPVYSVRYIVQEGDNAVTTAGNLQVRISLADDAGNESAQATNLLNNNLYIYTVRPTATLVGNDVVCYGDSATLIFNLTGIGPWNLKYSEGLNSYYVTGIPSSPHSIKVLSLATAEYNLDSVTESTGNYNSGAEGTSTVTVNPLPEPVIDSLENYYAYTNEEVIDLIGNPAGGVFSGPGVSNPRPGVYEFRPLGLPLTEGIPDTVRYEYIDKKGCYQDTTHLVHIVKGTVDFVYQKEDKWGCYLDDVFIITASNPDGKNGEFTITPLSDTSGFNPAEFYRESWDPLSMTDTLVLYPSVFGWGVSPYRESHDYDIVYNYIDNNGVPVKSNTTEEFHIEYFEPAVITSEIGTSETVFCSADNDRQIKGTFSANSVFYGPGIVDEGGGVYNFHPERADTGLNMVYYQYTAEHGCIQRDSVLMTVNQTPVPRLEWMDSCMVTDGDSIWFRNLTDTSGLGTVNFTWTFGDLSSPDNRLNVSDLDPVAHRYGGPGRYTVLLSAEVLMTGCQEDVESELNSKDYQFGNTPSPEISWTTECDKAAAIPISVASNTTDPVNNYRWLIRDQSGSTALETEGVSLNTLDFDYPQRDVYTIEVDILTTTGCENSVSDQIHIRPYFQDIAGGGAVMETFETIAEGWNSQPEFKGEQDSWIWDLAGSDSWPGTSINSGKTWYTDMDPENPEHSYVISPCYDFRGMNRPMVRLDYRSISDRNFDGAVLQYTKDDGDSWSNVGEIDDGSINWYNSFRIQDGPAEQGEGWTGPFEFDSTADWVNARHELDVLIGKPTVQFRIAYSNKGESVVLSKGFAFDNFWVGERSRVVLIEHFTNTGITGIGAIDNSISTLVRHNRNDVIDLQYHTRVDGATDQLNIDNPAPASARSLFYGTQLTPYTLLDGGVNNTMAYDYQEQMLDTLDLYTRALVDPLFNINLPDSIEDWTNFTISIQALSDMTESTCILYIVLAESDADGYRNVVRDMIPSTAGINMVQSWTSGQSRSFDLSYRLDAKLEGEDDLFLVAFVQNAGSKIIYQAASNNPDLNRPAEPVSTDAVRDYMLRRDLQMMVYPNPAQGEIYIAFSDIVNERIILEVYNHTGRKVRSLSLPAGTDRYRVDPGDLEKGIYFVRSIMRDKVLGTQRILLMGD